MHAAPQYYQAENGLVPIDPADWSETDMVDLVYHRPSRSAFFINITSDWKAAAKCMLSLDTPPDDLPGLSRQAIAFWWYKGPLGDGPRPF